MFRALLSSVERLCEARLTKRSTSEIGLGATVVSVSLIGKPKSSRWWYPARTMAGQSNSQPEIGKKQNSVSACVRQRACIRKVAL